MSKGFASNRLTLLAIGVIACFMGVGVRLVFLQVVDREAFRLWCDADPDLRRKMTLPWQTTNSLTKQLLLDGQPEPPGVTIWAKTTVRMGSE